MATPNEIVVVGGSLAGVRAAEALRRNGFTGRLTLIGDEVDYPPFDRPPLSKEMLLEDGADAETFRLDVDANLDLDLVLGERAVSLDLESRLVSTDHDRSTHFDGLVIATGTRLRKIMWPGVDLPGVLGLRTIGDSRHIADQLRAKPRVVVIGGGFIGSEVASACRARGLEVTVVDVAALPSVEAIGEQAARYLLAKHVEKGVNLRLGIGVESFGGSGRVESVRLSDGTTLEADLVVVGVGVIPETDWLLDSGLVIENGVLCDTQCAAIDVDDIVAAGDVARWFHPLFDDYVRVEHWTNAVEQAEFAAERLLAGGDLDRSFDAIPYFWSDQHGRRIQFAGRRGDSERLVEGSPDEDKFVLAYGTEGRLTGVLCVNWPARLAEYRRKISAREDFPNN